MRVRFYIKFNLKKKKLVKTSLLTGLFETSKNIGSELDISAMRLSTKRGIGFPTKKKKCNRFSTPTLLFSQYADNVFKETWNTLTGNRYFHLGYY